MVGHTIGAAAIVSRLGGFRHSPALKSTAAMLSGANNLMDMDEESFGLAY